MARSAKSSKPGGKSIEAAKRKKGRPRSVDRGEDFKKALAHPVDRELFNEICKRQRPERGLKKRLGKAFFTNRAEIASQGLLWSIDAKITEVIKHAIAAVCTYIGLNTKNNLRIAAEKVYEAAVRWADSCYGRLLSKDSREARTYDDCRIRPNCETARSYKELQTKREEISALREKCYGTPAFEKKHQEWKKLWEARIQFTQDHIKSNEGATPCIKCLEKSLERTISLLTEKQEDWRFPQGKKWLARYVVAELLGVAETTLREYLDKHSSKKCSADTGAHSKLLDRLVWPPITYGAPR